ncbi:U3 small nucleolar RNA-associated protein 5 [Rhizoctonia solani]|uniref:U3 small nucleolar RNA-associated protein 5 n=1 Tax=Rhizoctonia solani TaxID=456999 RepID=A0A0K6FSJ6_9AGAM|nr:U3 small nucleolar RNA-associated protein 5 [Rhizoctonia solani]
MRDKKAKNKATKPPTDRAVGTSALAQPSLYSPASRLSSFSPDGALFAFLSLAVDKHRLRVYDVATGSAVADHTFDGPRVTALVWGAFELTDESKASKKRRKRKSLTTDDAPAALSAIQLVALGLSDGSIVLFSPTQGTVVRTLSNPSYTAAITSIAPHNDSPTHLWASSEDGAIRYWNVPTSTSKDVATSTPCVALAPRPGVTETKDGVTHLLTAQTTIQLLPVSSDGIVQKELVTVPGHASPVIALIWEHHSSEPARRFVSAAEDDRVVSVWDAVNRKMIASVPLDSEARHITFGTENSVLLALAVSGKVSLYTLPEGAKSKGVSTLSPQSVISVEHAGKKGGDPALADVVAATFVPGAQGKVVLARLVGVKPVFDTLEYQDEDGKFLPEVKLTHKSANAGLTPDTNGVVPTKRYAEPQSLTIHSGTELAQDPSEAPPATSAADLDVELAEITLSERNKVLAEQPDSTSGQKRRHDSPSAEPELSTSKPNKKSLAVPAHSLSRTLAQALHSGDNALLETCLSHGDANLIRNTVLRLPPTLCVPLLQACVERLGRGGGGEKGGGAGASAQRGTSLIRWVRAVLVCHSGFLMTIPDLVSRLASLHATLGARLALQDRLLALNGRLDLVLSQIDVQSVPRAAVDEDVVVKKKKVRRKAARYVEGESESDDGMSVDQEEEGEDDDDDDEDEGSVEDIAFGSSGEEEDEEGEVDESDEEDQKMNGFIDDEAEEDYSEDEESSAEE